MPSHRGNPISWLMMIALINHWPCLTVSSFSPTTFGRRVEPWVLWRSQSEWRKANEPTDGWRIITSLVLDHISSRHTRRAYSQALDEFLIWFRDDPGRQFSKATVQKYRTELETKSMAPSSINVRLSAIRRLALEAADNGLMDPALASGIARAKGVRRSGVRLGHWLTAEQAERLLTLPNLETIKGVRDAAVLALLVGAGLRRVELAGLDCTHIQDREGRWLIADLISNKGESGACRSHCGSTWRSSAGRPPPAS